MNGRRIWVLILEILAACAALTMIIWIDGYQTRKKEALIRERDAQNAVRTEEVSVRKTEDLSGTHLHDKSLIYANDDDTSVVTMYLTVQRGPASENMDHSWEEINTYSAYYYEDLDIPRYQVAALLQVGDENGPLPGELGYGENLPNASVQIRGQTSSLYAQKNYKIKLKDTSGLWKGQQTISLNKHQSDGLRFRNKLANDLLEEIPELIGLRTQFVHLYVRDKTGDDPDTFADYGLYTQIEQPNSKMLQAHGLSKYGNLYKINSFEFYRYPDVIRLSTDPLYDQSAFERYLEPKTDNRHEKLIEMLEALNDINVPLSRLFEKYFDRENIIYWMAFEILIGNADTTSRNMYIYSPLNSSVWYIIPWDHDAVMTRQEFELKDIIEYQSWETGISNYWGNVLFQRCLKDDTFRADLDQVIEQMRKTVLYSENISSKASAYAEVVRPFVYSIPDVYNSPLTEAEYDQILKTLPDEVDLNYSLYKDSLTKPMPFFIYQPEIMETSDSRQLRIAWAPSYSFTETNIHYNIELSNDTDFSEPIFSKENLLITETYTEVPEPGMYFLRIRAVDEEGREQDAFDYYVMNNGSKLYGTFAFYLMEDGTIQTVEYDEG